MKNIHSHIMSQLLSIGAVYLHKSPVEYVIPDKKTPST